jgi:hypothetical protein
MPYPCTVRCPVHRLPPTEPSMVRYMSDNSKLQRSSVSLQAAASLITTHASIQASSHAKPLGSIQAKTQGSSTPAWSPAATIQACMGVCQSGLCTVNFETLHCCMANQRMAEQISGGFCWDIEGSIGCHMPQCIGTPRRPNQSVASGYCFLHAACLSKHLKVFVSVRHYGSADAACITVHNKSVCPQCLGV